MFIQINSLSNNYKHRLKLYDKSNTCILIINYEIIWELTYMLQLTKVQVLEKKVSCISQKQEQLLQNQEKILTAVLALQEEKKKNSKLEIPMQIKVLSIVLFLYASDLYCLVYVIARLFLTRCVNIIWYCVPLIHVNNLISSCVWCMRAPWSDIYSMSMSTPCVSIYNTHTNCSYFILCMSD